MKKARLEVEYEFNFAVIAFVTQLKEYKLAWILNKILHIRLKKDPDLTLEFLNEGRLKISNYIYSTENFTWRLLKNKSPEFDQVKYPLLIPELKEYDFFLILDNIEDESVIDQTMEGLKEIPEVVLVKQINVEELKSKDNLIF
jgi:hypothetical protein